MYQDWGGQPVVPPGYVQQPAQPYFQQSVPAVRQPVYYGSTYGPGSYGPYGSYAQGAHGGTAIIQGPVLPYGYPAVPPQPIMSQPMIIPRPPSPQIVYVPSPPSGASRSPSYSPLSAVPRRPHRHGRSRHHHHRGRSPEPEYARYSRGRSRSRSRSFSRSPVRAPPRPTMYFTTPAAHRVAPIGGGRMNGVQKQRDERQAEVPRLVLPDWMMHPDSTSPAYQLNPLLVGDSHQQTLVVVDMRVSSYTFEPKRLASPGATTGDALHKEELSQPATYPGVTEMSITCDELPQWKMELKSSVDPTPSVFNSVEERREHIPPLTVHDVLLGIQRSVRSSVSHEEWDQLSADHQKSIADAYIRRCRANPETKVFEESQGVRRVDYLLDKHFFKGLVLPKGPEQFKNVKLIVGKK